MPPRVPGGIFLIDFTIFPSSLLHDGLPLPIAFPVARKGNQRIPEACERVYGLVDHFPAICVADQIGRNPEDPQQKSSGPCEVRPR